MKLHIATPAYEGKVHAGYAQCLLVAGQICYRNGIEVSSTIPKNGMFIHIARNILVRQFLEETDCTHLMFIDSDLKFPPESVYGLANAGLPVAAGIYRQREEKMRYVFRLPDNKIIMNNGWLRVDRLPGGFMCIRRDVLQEMTDRAPRVKVTNQGDLPYVFRLQDEGSFIGEDLCWCDDYTKLYHEGVFEQPIWIWPDITFDHNGYVGNLSWHMDEFKEQGVISDAEDDS